VAAVAVEAPITLVVMALVVAAQVFLAKVPMEHQELIKVLQQLITQAVVAVQVAAVAVQL
jgi:hypothetical protein